MADKKDKENNGADSQPNLATQVKRTALMRGLAVLLFVAASTVLFVVVADIKLFGIGKALAGSVVFAVPVQFVAVALADFANGRLRQLEIGRFEEEQAMFQAAVTARTDVLHSKVDDNLQDVLNRLFEEKDALRGEIEAMKAEERQRLVDQLHSLSSKNEELERKLINISAKEPETATHANEAEADPHNEKIFAA